MRELQRTSYSNERDAGLYLLEPSVPASMDVVYMLHWYTKGEKKYIFARMVMRLDAVAMREMYHAQPGVKISQQFNHLPLYREHAEISEDTKWNLYIYIGRLESRKIKGEKLKKERAEWRERERNKRERFSPSE